MFVMVMVHVWSTCHRSGAVHNGLQRYVVRAGRGRDPAGTGQRAEPSKAARGLRPSLTDEHEQRWTAPGRLTAPRRGEVRVDLGKYQAGPGQAEDGGPDRHPPDASSDPGQPQVGDRAHPRPGQPVRHSALAHRAPPAGGGVLARACQHRHRLRPAAPPRLDPLPLGRPLTAPP
jgi:hypothetical protein